MSGRAPRPRPSVVMVRVRVQIPPSVPKIFLQAMRRAAQGPPLMKRGAPGCEGRGRRHTTTATILRQQASPCKTPGRMRRYCLDKGFWRTLKTQPLSTRRYPSEPSLSGSSPDDPRSALDPLTWRRWLNLLESGYNRRRWIGHQSSKRVHDGEPNSWAPRNAIVQLRRSLSTAPATPRWVIVHRASVIAHLDLHPQAQLR
jgi:hypothetical protein